jgi:hypothetical protein
MMQANNQISKLGYIRGAVISQGINDTNLYSINFISSASDEEFEAEEVIKIKPTKSELNKLKKYGDSPTENAIKKADNLLQEMSKRGVDLSIVERYAYKIIYSPSEERSVGEFILEHLDKLKN